MLLRDIEIGGERNRGMYVLKSRGMAHSNQIREFKLTKEGAQLLEVYVGSTGVLTGTSRIIQEEKETAETLIQQEELNRKQKELARKHKIIEAQINAIKLQFESEKESAINEIAIDKIRIKQLAQNKIEMEKNRTTRING